MDDLPKLALSVRQPWAYSIMELGKPVENRSWPTKIRGRICLHAAKRMTRDEWRDGIETARIAGVGYEALNSFPFPQALLRGGIIGTVDIVDCVTDHPSRWFFGPYGFVLRDARPVPFIPVKGALGFFEWRKNILETAAC